MNTNNDYDDYERVNWGENIQAIEINNNNNNNNNNKIEKLNLKKEKNDVVEKDVWRKRKSNIDNDPIIGIDFGTSNSCLSIWHPIKNRSKVIKLTNKEIGLKKNYTPSTVLFNGVGDDYNTVKVGIDANDEQLQLSGIKTVLGLSYSDMIKSMKSSTLQQSLPNDIEKDNNDNLFIRCYNQSIKNDHNNGKLISPEEISSHIFKYLKDKSEDYINLKKNINIFKNEKNQLNKNLINVHRVVIGVPATYSKIRRDATIKAAELAGFDDVHLMIESTAAAMAYGLLVAGRKNVMIFDMGGGTTDVTIMHINDGRYIVESTGGSSNCGGRNIDLLLLYYIFDMMIEEQYVVDDNLEEIDEDINDSNFIDSFNLQSFLQHLNLKTKQTILAACCKCKEELTTNDLSYITFPIHLLNLFISPTWVTESSNEAFTIVNEHIRIPISRDIFNSITKPIYNKVNETVSEVLKQWKISKNKIKMTELGTPNDAKDLLNINEIVIVGGSSRIPFIHSSVRDAITKFGVKEFSENDLDHIGVPMKELCTSVNADESVAQGLAIRGGVLMGIDSGHLKDVLMIDVLPSSIGLLLWKDNEDIDTNEDDKDEINKINRYFEPILLKGDQLPIIKKKIIKLADVNQKKVSLDIYEELDDITYIDDLIETSDGDNSENRLINYKYSKLSSYDFPVPSMEKNGTKPTSVVVIFKIDEEGNLSCDVDCEDNDGIASKHQSELSMMLLSFYLFLMIVLYGYVKYQLYTPDVGIDNINNVDINNLIKNEL